MEADRAGRQAPSDTLRDAAARARPCSLMAGTQQATQAMAMPRICEAPLGSLKPETGRQETEPSARGVGSRQPKATPRFLGLTPRRLGLTPRKLNLGGEYAGLDPCDPRLLIAALDEDRSRLREQWHADIVQLEEVAQLIDTENTRLRQQLIDVASAGSQRPTKPADEEEWAPQPTPREAAVPASVAVEEVFYELERLERALFEEQERSSSLAEERDKLAETNEQLKNTNEQRECDIVSLETMLTQVLDDNETLMKKVYSLQSGCRDKQDSILPQLPHTKAKLGEPAPEASPEAASFEPETVHLDSTSASSRDPADTSLDISIRSHSSSSGREDPLDEH